MLDDGSIQGWGANHQYQLDIPNFIVDNDSDNDTVCDDLDQCDGYDDYIDYDNDNIIDGCDECVGIDTIDDDCVLYGDINQDGNITLDDAMIILSYLLGSSGELLGMDYNQDGTVTLLDFTLLIYDNFSMDVSESQNNTSSVEIGTYYNSINLFSEEYIGGVMLYLTNLSDDFAISISDSYVSMYFDHGDDIKILFMDDPEDSVSLDTELVTVISGTYQFNTEESQIVDIDSHIDFSVVYHMGDVNMDISINVLDVVHMIDYILSISPDINPYTDINSDGTVNVMDVILLVSYIFYMP